MTDQQKLFHQTHTVAHQHRGKVLSLAQQKGVCVHLLLCGQHGYGSTELL